MPEAAPTDSLSITTTAADTLLTVTAAVDRVPEGFRDSDRICPLEKAPMLPRPDRDAYTSRPSGWQTGIEAMPLQRLPGYDSGVMTLVLATLLTVSFNFRHYSSFIKSFTADIWSVRRRANIFDDPTVNERGVMMSLILLVNVAEASLIFSWMHSAGMLHGSPARGIAIAMAATVCYYLWQLAAYSIVGFTFAPKADKSQWLRGFNASQAMLGLTLILPALIALFYPGAAATMAVLGATLYIIARIIFIIKGFRIFHTGFSSLLYFILYLCALEITPLMAAWRLASGEITLV